MREFHCAPAHGKWYIDPFIEVQTLPPQLHEWPEERDIYKMRCSRIETLADTIAAVIEREWQPDKFHLVWHSSGYDSRIISGILKDLRKKNGDDWLGDILFLCNRWEAEGFYRIMKAQGWERNLYAVYEGGLDDEHYKIALDFGSFWYEANAPVPMPGRFWFYVAKWAKSKGLLPEDNIQAFNGQGKMFWRSNYKTLADYKQYMYDELYSETTIDSPNGLAYGSILSDIDVMGAVYGYSDKRRAKRGLTLELAEFVSPETADIKNMRRHDHLNVPIAEDILSDCKDAFDGSWYAKELDIKWQPPETAAIDPRWGEWGLASLCEHLIGEGTEICVV
jgi:hypothetical protein